MTVRNHENSTDSTDATNLAFCEMIQLLSQCHRQLRRVLSDRLGPLRLSDTEFLALWLCQQAEPRGLVQRDLADALGVSPPQVSVLVERLRQQKLLSSRRCRLDRRRQLWGIDHAGCRLLARIGTELRELSVMFDRSLSGAQQSELTALLRRLAAMDGSEPAQASEVTADDTAAVPLRLYRPDEDKINGVTEAHDVAAVRKTA
jgi:DNA-binding MarR family transcriptional regulator